MKKSIIITLIFLFAHLCAHISNRSYIGHEYADGDTFLIPQTADMDIGPHMSLVASKLLILYAVKETKGSDVQYIIYDDTKTKQRVMRLTGKCMILPYDNQIYKYTFSEDDLLNIVGMLKVKLAQFNRIGTQTLSLKIISSYCMMSIEGAMMLLHKFRYGPLAGEKKF